MTKLLRTANVRAILGLAYDCEIADYFGISKAAVSKWGSVLPPDRVAQLIEENPGLFDDYRGDKE
jgi:hypothetical protein